MVKYLFKSLWDFLMLIILWIVQFALIYVIAFKIFNVESPITSTFITWMITTVTIMFIGLNAMSNVMTHVSNNHKAEIDKLEKDKINLNNAILDLNGELALKNDEIETMKQTKCLVTNYKSSRELQILTVSKSGNIVKEEELYPLKKAKNKEGVEIFSENFPKVFDFFNARNGRELTKEDKWRVFYSDNKLYKYGVGIKFDDVSYAVDLNSNIIYFKNIKLSLLEDRREKMSDGNFTPDKNITNHVWIVEKNDKEDYKIVNQKQHTYFRNTYKDFQRDSADFAIQGAIKNLCEFFTIGLHNMLISRYGNNIHFVKDDENVDYLDWKTFSEGLQTNKDVRAFMNDLYLAFDAMQLCADNNLNLDNALIPEKASA